MNRSAPRLNITANRLLAALPGPALGLLYPHFSSVHLAAGATVYEVGEEIDRIYFPTNGIASLQMVMNDGRAIDTAIVGRDDVLGAMAAYAPRRAAARCVVRSTITAFQISALEYRRAAAGEVALQMLIIQYQHTLLWQTQTNAARYANLPIDQRLAACLLDVSNLLASESVRLTQETLAEMLASRRTYVSEVVSKLKADGVVDYARGEIRILERVCWNWRSRTNVGLPQLAASLISSERSMSLIGTIIGMKSLP
jgi:CRP-like cAMP-binding protein